MDPEKRLTACAPRPQRWKRRQMRRRHVRSLHPAPAFAPAAPHSITACFAGSKHTMQASFPKRSLSCPDALDPACRAPAPERGENAHATGNVETRRPEPKTASDSPGMPKAAPLRCCAHGGSRGTGARWRLRSFIREDNANPNRGSCTDTLPTAKTRAASGRDGGCEASSGMTMRTPTAAAAQIRCRRQKPVRHRGEMAAEKLHPGRQCESQLRQLRRYAADGKNPCGIGAGWLLRSLIREDNAPQRRSFNTVARCRTGRNDSAGGHGRPAHRPEADGRPNRKRALTERRQTT